MSNEVYNDELLIIANRLVGASSHEWPRIFEDLRRRKRLAEFVRYLNRLLDEGPHRQLAQSALKRFGLEHAG